MILITILAVITSIISLLRTHSLNEETDKKNKELISLNSFLYIKNQELREQNEKEFSELTRSRQELDVVRKSIEKENETLKNAQGFSQNYFSLLEETYKKEEENFDNSLKDLQKATEEKIKQIKKEELQEENELKKIKATRAAMIDAANREKEILNNKDFFSLEISESDLYDIKILNNVKPTLKNPRILSMLIWSTYFQKPMTALCNRVIGNKEFCGIYKITNLITNECYIGQAVDMPKRWKEHGKCGLGIDTPQGNKLYKAMQEYGLQNFTFEVLEKCDNKKEELNEKERFYIDAYLSKDFGYNSTKGNK